MKIPANSNTKLFARRYNLAVEKAQRIKFDSFNLWSKLACLVPEQDKQLVIIISEDGNTSTVTHTNLLLAIIIYTVQTQANDSNRDAFYIKIILDCINLDIEQANYLFHIYTEIAETSIVHTHKFALIIKELIQAQNN